MQKPDLVGENHLLQRTNTADLARRRPHRKNFSMELGAVLHVAGASIKHVYFPLSGMVSLLAVMRTGEQIETAIVGRVRCRRRIADECRRRRWSWPRLMTNLILTRDSLVSPTSIYH